MNQDRRCIFFLSALLLLSHGRKAHLGAGKGCPPSLPDFGGLLGCLPGNPSALADARPGPRAPQGPVSPHAQPKFGFQMVRLECALMPVARSKTSKSIRKRGWAAAAHRSTCKQVTLIKSEMAQLDLPHALVAVYTCKQEQFSIASMSTVTTFRPPTACQHFTDRSIESVYGQGTQTYSHRSSQLMCYVADPARVTGIRAWVDEKSS